MELIKEDYLYFTNYHLASSVSIVHEIYEGEFKKCLNDENETEISSKPFKIKLIYRRGDDEEKLLGFHLLEGDMTEEEVNKIIETM